MWILGQAFQFVRPVFQPDWALKMLKNIYFAANIPKTTSAPSQHAHCRSSAKSNNIVLNRSFKKYLSKKLLRRIKQKQRKGTKPFKTKRRQYETRKLYMKNTRNGRFKTSPRMASPQAAISDLQRPQTGTGRLFLKLNITAGTTDQRTTNKSRSFAAVTARARPRRITHRRSACSSDASPEKSYITAQAQNKLSDARSSRGKRATRN